LKKAQKGSEISEDEFHQAQKSIQDITDDYIARIEELVEDKEAEVMEV
jgi:ribosome recycling factor